MTPDLRIVFMGTPDFALCALKSLYENGYNITSVFTAEDKPRGRGHKLTPTPVKAYSLEKGIDVYTPKTLRGGEAAEILRAQNPDFIVVAAYGKILPQDVLQIPKYGCINIHASLLPEYRGAAPIQRAIIDGREKSGVTVMHMEEGLDTGDIYARGEVKIKPGDNFEDLHDALAEKGAELIAEALPKIASGEYKRIKQDDGLSSYAAKIEQSDRIIDFSKPAAEIINRIRGLSPIPLAFVKHRGKLLKITSTEPEVYGKKSDVPGKVCEISQSRDGYIEVACGDGDIRITGVIPEGRGRQSAGDFVRGRGIEEGEILESPEE